MHALQCYNNIKHASCSNGKHGLDWGELKLSLLEKQEIKNSYAVVCVIAHNNLLLWCKHAY